MKLVLKEYTNINYYKKRYRKWFGDTTLEFPKYQKTGQGP